MVISVSRCITARRLGMSSATIVRVTRRLTQARTQHGAKAAPWWTFDRDDALHCDMAGTVNVQPYGKTIAHTKVRPTPAQRQLAAAGGRDQAVRL
ncbi:hypothetical protein ACWELO_05225 [Streptomyces sp. NPDC004596]